METHIGSYHSVFSPITAIVLSPMAGACDIQAKQKGGSVASHVRRKRYGMFTQYVLPYDFGSLEPYIDQLTMVTHYTKHRAGYTNNLTNAMKNLPALANATIEDILGNLDQISDPVLRTTVRNNGKGFWNHNLYVSILSLMRRKTYPARSPIKSRRILDRLTCCVTRFPA